jgi:toxin ParE1/3/4
MNQCIYSLAARLDLLELYDYIAQESPDAARRMIERLEEICEWLAVNREMGERGDRIRPGARLYSVGNYVIFYEIAGDDIRVLRVMHGARDYNLLF